MKGGPGRSKRARSAGGAERRAWPTALAAGAATAVVGYAALRVVERAFFPEPNPAIVIWSDRSSFAWRAVFSLYFGGFGTFGALALARRSGGDPLGWLPPLIGGAALALVLQAILFP